MRGLWRRRRAWAVGVASALLLGACSSRGTASPAAPQPSAPPPPSSTTTTVAPPGPAEVTTSAGPLDFTTLGEMLVTVDGERMPLRDAGLTYQRSVASVFDDPATPAHDGIASDIRVFLACEKGDWSIGSQTHTVGLIAQGLVEGDASLVERGARGIDWAVANTTVDGDGEHRLQRTCDGRTVTSAGGMQTTSQWLASMAEAVLLLQSAPDADQHEERIARYLLRMEEIVTVLVTPENWTTWQTTWLVDDDGRLFTHKTYLMAAGLGVTAQLSTDPNAGRWALLAATLARKGVASQWPSGVNPERGGYDVLYQMYGTWMAEIYHSTLPPGPLKAGVGGVIDASVAWLSARTDASGRVDIGASTRVCNDQDGAQPYSAADAVRVLLTWGMVRRDDALVDMAVLVDNGAQIGNPCPPR